MRLSTVCIETVNTTTVVVLYFYIFLCMIFKQVKSPSIVSRLQRDINSPRLLIYKDLYNVEDLSIMSGIQI